MYYKVKEVADMVGISVRMLHHYDKIDLLQPEFINQAGYRFYSNSDLERLQQVLFFKELDFNLQEIKSILDNPDFDKMQALKSQHELLLEKKKRLEKIINTVEKTIYSIEGEIKMDNKEMFGAFSMIDIERHKEKYAEEAKEKYGDSDAYKECNKKTAKYTKEDWSTISGEADNIMKKLVLLMDIDPRDSQVQEVVEEYRQYITKNFYQCTREIFRGLGELYVTDERFTANFDKYKPGLAQFLSDAIKFYTK